MRQTKTFGCHHCQEIFQILKPTRGHRSKNSGERVEKRFTFDGLVSHVKEKHGIYPMGEEDFYRDSRVIVGGEEMQLR